MTRTLQELQEDWTVSNASKAVEALVTTEGPVRLPFEDVMERAAHAQVYAMLAIADAIAKAR